MAALGIGARLKEARVRKGLKIDDVSRATKIAPRYLEAIEKGDHTSLPGLVFIRGFVRQYALALNLDPDPLLAALPKPDESTAPLPNPPLNPRPRSSYLRERQVRTLITASAWLGGLAVIGALAYLGFHHYSIRLLLAPRNQTIVRAAGPPPQPRALAEQQTPPRAAVPDTLQTPVAPPASPAAPIQVSMTAHARAWIRLSVDGRIIFMGTLAPNETKEISATEPVTLLTGNAGALTVSLNGKTLDPLGRPGQMRELRLTAEGPEFLPKDSPPQPESGQL